jgi:5-methylcytosine-specific restriction protein B
MSQVIKDLPANITKEHLLQAIAKIDVEGIPVNSDSNYYDVVYNDKNYPPKVIVSISNLFANGQIIDRNTFSGGSGTLCFKLLEENGFKIIPKELNSSFQTAIDIREEKEGVVPDRILTQEEFLAYIQLFDKEELNQYFKWLKYFLKQLNISFGDERITYNYYNRSLIFTVGQRYGLIYKPFDNEAKYFLMSRSSIGNLNKDNTFSGDPLCFFCRRNDLDLTMEEANEVLNGMIVEIDRTDRSRYRKYNKDNFERFILEKYNGEMECPSLITSFMNASSQQNLLFSSYLTKRYIASLATKPFVIFTGLSGSGKTKLAQTFAKWICESDDQYKIIPVGADWTNREPLLGYPNSLEPDKYVLPDNGALDLILAAIENAKGKELKDCEPYFLILDEMNLSHVERYFADFLSGMESKEDISLYAGTARNDEIGRNIPQNIKLPPNLFIVGTVNIDETTYMFSPQVLDRANTIEFRVDKKDLERFFDSQHYETIEMAVGIGAAFSRGFMALVSKVTLVTHNYEEQLLGFFKALQPIGAEFGYRTANEMNRLMAQLEGLGLETNENVLDAAVMQKLLPKLHGSRTKLNKVLPLLASFCFKGCSMEQAKIILDEVKREGLIISENKPNLPLSFAKIARMYNAAQENGFTSYAEG